VLTISCTKRKREKKTKFRGGGGVGFDAIFGEEAQKIVRL
jgi:hypothetical protein